MVDFAEEAGQKDSMMRSMALGRKFEWAPWRRRLPTSSSSNKPARLMVPLVVELVSEIRASMAAKQQSLSSRRPAKMNSLESPPSWAAWESCISSSQFIIVL